MPLTDVATQSPRGTGFSAADRPWVLTTTPTRSMDGLAARVRAGVRIERQRGLRSGLGDRRRELEAEQLGHVFDLRQIRQVVESESLQEFARRAVQKRPADNLLAADDLDELPLHQR